MHLDHVDGGARSRIGMEQQWTEDTLLLLHTSSRERLIMKLSLSLLAWGALSLCSTVSAASASTDKQQQLSPRQVKLHSLASKNNGIVPLTSQLYDELLQDTPSNPRDYSVSIILTALNPKFGCQPCVGFDKEHKEVAKQWWNRPENRKDRSNQMRHVFAVLDFEKGQDIFKRVS